MSRLTFSVLVIQLSGANCTRKGQEEEREEKRRQHQIRQVEETCCDASGGVEKGPEEVQAGDNEERQQASHDER